MKQHRVNRRIFVVGCMYLAIYMVVSCLSFWVLWIPYAWAIKDCSGPEDYAIYSEEYCNEQNARIWQEMLDSELFATVRTINILAITPLLFVVLFLVYVYRSLIVSFFGKLAEGFRNIIYRVYRRIYWLMFEWYEK